METLASNRSEGVKNAPITKLSRLPGPGEKCPICCRSRGWMIDANQKLPQEERFLFSIKIREGATRAAVFVNVPKLLALLDRAQELGSITIS